MSNAPSSFQITRQRLALWYTTVTAVLLLIFASGFYGYVRMTLIERIDDTLNHVVEVVGRSLTIDPAAPMVGTAPRLNIEASFRDNAESVEDDHIDLEWFDATGALVWSTFSAPLDVPVHVNSGGETVEARMKDEADLLASSKPEGLVPPNSLHPSSLALRQVTQQVTVDGQILGYLRVSHPWFEVSKPARQLVRDLSLGTVVILSVVAAIGWFLSGLAIAPVRESYQRLKQFTADASHELRNPIAVIQTNVQVALADPNPDPQEQQEQFKVIERLTRRLGRLVDDLLFLARQDSGMIPQKTERLALEELLHEVIEEQEAIATEKGVTLSLLWHEGTSCKMLGDRDQLIRLFTNLISNAVQHTPPAGQVSITLQPVKNQGAPQFQLQVRDTGAGIAPAALPYVFDRFYRADPARSHGETRNGQGTQSAGSGLGLAIAKVIAENHQGTIQADSPPNAGAVFTVTLPAL